MPGFWSLRTRGGVAQSVVEVSSTTEPVLTPVELYTADDIVTGFVADRGFRLSDILNEVSLLPVERPKRISFDDREDTASEEPHLGRPSRASRRSTSTWAAGKAASSVNRNRSPTSSNAAPSRMIAAIAAVGRARRWRSRRRMPDGFGTSTSRTRTNGGSHAVGGVMPPSVASDHGRAL